MPEYAGPVAVTVKPMADVVFCIDATESMKPCLEGVLQQVGQFVESLHSAGNVDFRLRLIAYRDLHDERVSDQEWNIYDFTSSVEEFRMQLGVVRPFGGGDLPESTLDALYMAIHSDWREERQVHRAIVLLTDADTHPTLHSSTYDRPDNDYHRVLQDFNELPHVRLQMVVPRFPIYEALAKAMTQADRTIIADFVDPTQANEGLATIDWNRLLKRLGMKVSQTSTTLARQVKA